MINRFRKSAVVGLLCLCSLGAAAEESVNKMTYDLALKAIDASEAYAREKGWNVTILVTDQNANPVMLRRLDGASVRSLGFVESKALVVTKTGLSTGEYAAKLARGEISEIEGGVTYKGGVPVYAAGKLIGVVATSGVQDYQDREVSLAGVETIGKLLAAE